MKTRMTVVVAAGLALSAGLLGGCAGHGKYTGEHATLAKARLDMLKASTEYDMGLQAFLAGDLNKAKRKAEIAAALHPDLARAQVLLGRVAIEEGEMGAAVTALRQATSIDDQSVDAWYYLGVACERLRRREDALAAYRRAAELDPFNARHAVAVGEVLIDLGRVDEAMAELAASPAAADSAGIHHLLGHAAMIQGDSDRAVSLMEDARLLAPNDGIIVEDLIDAQLAAGKFTDAEFAISRLRRETANTERRDLRVLHARCLRELDRLPEAYRLLADLTDDREGRDDAAAWTALGEVAQQLGDASTVQRAASRLVSIAPERPEGDTLFAVHRLSKGEADRCLKAAEDGLKNVGGNVDLISLKAIALSELNRKDEADKALAELDLIAGDPTTPLVQRIHQAVRGDAYVAAPTD